MDGASTCVETLLILPLSLVTPWQQDDYGLHSRLRLGSTPSPRAISAISQSRNPGRSRPNYISSPSHRHTAQSFRLSAIHVRCPLAPSRNPSQSLPTYFSSPLSSPILPRPFGYQPPTLAAQSRLVTSIALSCAIHNGTSPVLLFALV